MSFITNWMREDILNLNSYTIQHSDNKLKLDAMESPFALPEELQTQLLEKLKNTQLNRYPASHNALQSVIRKLMNIPDNLQIMLGNGSDELIQILMLGCNSGDSIMGFTPSFVMYEIIAKWRQLQFSSIALTNDFEIDLENTLQQITKQQPKIIFIAYPNNPTGNNFNKEHIIQIIQHSKNLVVIDEAYYAYNDESFIDELQHFENVIVLRTISKIGFAGLRLGVMIAKSEIISEFDKLRMPYNINSLTMVAAEFLLSNKEYIAQNAETIKQQRTIVFNALNDVKSITAFKSDANFILFKTPQSDALFEFLHTNNILIKNMGNNLLRTTISTPEENAIFLNGVAKFYE
jgi:histidinol-phosphate aminotransferase